LVVDPGESDGVLAWLAEHHLKLQTILVTHHHGDHTGGVLPLQKATGVQVVAPAHEWPGAEALRVSGGSTFEALGLKWQVMDVPGHTLGHVAYRCDSVALATGAVPLVFCGDTLFSAGCGRLFEGSPAQMLQSLNALARLPDRTLVCCTHEYTLSNIRFALAADPANPDLLAWQQQCLQRRALHQPTLPSTMGLERRINPFLRVREPALQASAQARQPGAKTDVDVLAALREWKNVFQ
jgi:hydroxyacylglutathione hydrolase